MKRTTFLAATAASAAPRIALAQATTLRLAGVFSDLFAEPFYAGPSVHLPNRASRSRRRR